MDKMFYYRLGQKRGGGGAPVISAEGWGDHYVAFMSDDGATRLTVRGVPNGTTCPDPIESGAISKPIKPTANGYAYTFKGWTKTRGGEAESNALRNVKADTDLYAVFDASEIMYSKLIGRSITSYANDEITSVGGYAFNRCSNLTSVNCPAVTSVGEHAFSYCYNLAHINFPSVTNLGMQAVYSCSAITEVDFPALESTTGGAQFSNCSNLVAVILRRTDKVCTLANKSAFTATPIANGTGYIYVPAALVDSYKAATNWSAYSAQFRALEDYTVDGTVTGTLDPTKV